MPKPKTPKEYAIEAAEKRLKMRDCPRRCGATVWGGFVDVSWVYMDPINLTPDEEARFIAADVPTWEVRWVGRSWHVEYRFKMHFVFEARRGSRHIVFANHICRNNPRGENNDRRH